MQKIYVCIPAKVFRLPLALSSGGLNLAQSNTHHGTDSFERVRPSIQLFNYSGSPAGLVRWLYWGEDGQLFEALARDSFPLEL